MNKVKNSIKYTRVLLKLSGESLIDINGSSKIHIKSLDFLSKEIKRIIDLNIELGIVIGAGNLFRGSQLQKMGINRVVSDHIGMLSTVINGLAINNSMNKMNIKTELMSAIPLNGICEIYNWSRAINLLSKKIVVIFSAGIGNPFFTTDSAACLRAIEVHADIVLKGTLVDGVYTSDPKKNNNAILYSKLSYKEVLKKELKIMDLSAFSLARDYKLPICVFNINKPGALYRIITGVSEGTLIN
ncbi:MAG: UMP kinase [Buchnera aphidicola (Periphyllus lyropictus)]|uniref:UMP kinase n=1 Tax=Buchnera aphidicola TaxID=9 RepID=UPI001EB59CEE|nr:UMP kinase [Buchnera aphidicola]NIH16638.1 UMP kinase [Buchnera aphidicola (Periphyllus lyropictus)]USS94548.1 UMP kinase [Buchnera aphidicola (Periphyllus lyropictus)]